MRKWCKKMGIEIFRQVTHFPRSCHIICCLGFVICRITAPVSAPPTKSLREIQEEQARQQMERNKQQSKAQPVS